MGGILQSAHWQQAFKKKKPALGKHCFSKNRGGNPVDREQINYYL
jgi:hypothetical protein